VSTQAELLAAIATQIETSTGATRLLSDLRNDLEEIPIGLDRYQLIGGAAGIEIVGSNETLVRESIEIFVHHRLAGLERTYTEGPMQTEVAELTNPLTWLALPEIYSLPELPEWELERVRKVVTTKIAFVVSIAP